MRATERAGAKQAGSGRGPVERGPVAGGESGSVRDVARGWAARAAWEQAGCWVLAWPRWAAAGQAGVERAGQGLGPRVWGSWVFFNLFYFYSKINKV